MKDADRIKRSGISPPLKRSRNEPAVPKLKLSLWPLDCSNSAPSISTIACTAPALMTLIVATVYSPLIAGAMVKAIYIPSILQSSKIANAPPPLFFAARGRRNLSPLSRGPLISLGQSRGVERQSARPFFPFRVPFRDAGAFWRSTWLSPAAFGHKLSSRPRFLGRGLGGCYPLPPVPVQRAPRRPVLMPDGRSPGAARVQRERTPPPAGATSGPIISDAS